jgi:hypothetical protein
MDLYNTEAAFTNQDSNALEQKLGVYLYTGATNLVVLTQNKLATAREIFRTAVRRTPFPGKQ